ncbi:hypothetical protein GNI_098340 [Gregarina niphandrodes]|uniref:Uncharacterized protein n=1 Tax=Gregarina niphandrodes TaxID=110365 RepID=A0A023B4T6_GRENI|nr:hypothetical protein GNI_098340 [Gregarina niphandrodes]EZG57276.1 hypothetical protein GNI_098340 [Gregarina niphandrodes]|eukprot:XP_011131060.1 hypothetical protein GNI_098340 [Gregarina niphandrodes]
MAETDAVEIKVKTTFSAAENWVDSCKAKRAQNQLQKKMNQKARQKLEEERGKLLTEQKAAEEKLEKIQNNLHDIELLFQKVDQQERDILLVEEQIAREENEIAEREKNLKIRLNDIVEITATPPDSCTTIAAESPMSNILYRAKSANHEIPKTAPPGGSHHLESVSSPIAQTPSLRT